jgi:hypothetical protein
VKQNGARPSTADFGSGNPDEDEKPMSVIEIIAEAARHGVTMKLDGGKLALRYAAEPPADLLAVIRGYTAAIIRHLSDKDPAGESHLASDFPPAELFADNVRKSLLCHAEILDHPFDSEDFRMARIKSDTATAVLNVAARGSPGELRIKQDASRVASPRLIERVIEARRILAERRSRRD